MAINLTDSLNAATTKGKLGDAKQIFLNGDTKNLQQAHEETNAHLGTLDNRSTQMENAIKDISVSGGASTANAVSYDSSTSGLESVNVQGALDELKANIIQETERAKEAEENKVDGTYEDNPEFIRVYKDADDRLLWWINADGSVDWAHGVPQPVQEELRKLEQLINDNLTGDEQLKERVAANETAIVAINEALDRKVDGVYGDNPEYIKTETDSEDRILNGIKSDGTNYMPIADIDKLSLNSESVDNDSVLVNYHVESLEFIRYYCDSDGRLLWWINRDGSVDWGSGVPQPIQVELQRLEQLINNNKDSVTEQIEAINNHLNEALAYKESPEYIKMLQDADDRIINAVTPDGTNYLPKAEIEELSLDGDVIDNDAAKSQVYTESPEFISYTTDGDDRVLEGFKPDGTKYINKLDVDKADVSQLSISGDVIDNEVIKTHSIEDSPEFINVEKDVDNKILSYTKPDGSHYIHNLESETIPTEFSNIDDVENRIEIQKDSDERILSYRDSEGKLHENVGIETPDINTQVINTTTIKTDKISLSQVGLTEFEQALRANGFRSGQGDWSDATSLHIPEPRCAIMNIKSADGTPYSWPTSKFVNNKVWVEFYDMQGNYFKKRAIHNAQGNSSMTFVKKNGAFDFCNDEWIGDDTFSVKFGDWVYQDSFHVKAYYTDFFKGVSVVAYKFADIIEKARGTLNDRPWKNALLKDYELGSDQINSSQINDLTLQLNNEAKCHPDGFPCIIYIDGEFYGIYAFCLKKHRDNMHQTKDVAEHIHLDGTLTPNTIWNGVIDWTQFEIRNPKNLYYKESHNGTFEYDADIAQAEIAGDEEVNAWIEAGQLPDGTSISSKIKKRLQTTAKVKKYIIDLSNRLAQIDAVSSSEEKKNIFEKYFDVNNLVDYEIVQMVTGDYDSYQKNWQWTTYDGIKWWVNEYDKDMSFGGQWTGMFTISVSNTGGWMGNNIVSPLQYTISLYSDEIVKRWKELYGTIISKENIINLFNDWLDRIGTDNFEKEYKKWTEAPCNRDDYLNSEYWQRTNEYKYPESNDYDENRLYTAGETCWFGYEYSFMFRCVKNTQGNPPLLGHYELFPKTLGYRDSYWRLVNFISQRIEKENNFINSLI